MWKKTFRFKPEGQDLSVTHAVTYSLNSGLRLPIYKTLLSNRNSMDS